MKVTVYKTKNYQIKVWKISSKYYKSFPWRFSIIDPNGKESNFVGIPNYCESKHSAYMRGLWRMRWMIRGEWDKHYK